MHYLRPTLYFKHQKLFFYSKKELLAVDLTLQTMPTEDHKNVMNNNQYNSNADKFTKDDKKEKKLLTDYDTDLSKDDLIPRTR